MSTTFEPIVVSQCFDKPVATVWEAITNKDQMRAWFFDAMNDFQPVVGFETEFDVHHDGQVYPHQWKVTDVVPQARISYDWRYGGFPGDSMVTWELTAVPAGTQLTITHDVKEPFPQDNPVFSRESGVAGWKYFLQESLPAFLDAKDRPGE